MIIIEMTELSNSLNYEFILFIGIYLINVKEPEKSRSFPPLSLSFAM